MDVDSPCDRPPTISTPPVFLAENAEVRKGDCEGTQSSDKEVPFLDTQHQCSTPVSSRPRVQDISPPNISSALSAAKDMAESNIASALPVAPDRAQIADEDTEQLHDDTARLQVDANENLFDGPNSVLAGSSCHHIEESRMVTPRQNRRPFRSLENIIHELPPSPPGAPRKFRAFNVRNQYRSDRDSLSFDLTHADELSSPNESSEENCARDEAECPNSLPTINMVPNVDSERDDVPFLLARRDNLNFSAVDAAPGVVKIAVGLSIDSSFAGELRISPHSSTGTQSTFQNNEFYFIYRGCLEWDIDATRVRVCAGDFVGVPHATSFNIRNPSFQEAVVIYFSPACHFP